ncbi:MAG TPA: glycosyltransferase [Chitinophagaceae bacterium]|nr:glycosyltransferase [Chitinophagaceae bacterium]
MNILNLAISDSGGAGQVSSNTNRFFIERGYNSVLVVKETELNDKNVIAFGRTQLPGSFILKCKYCFQKVLRLYRRFFPLEINENFSFHGIRERKKHISAAKILRRIPFKPDVIIIYWVSDFINTKTIYDLEKLSGAKILWVMTDNAPMTGGCHYPWDCKGFESDCKNCPAILTDSKKKIAEENLAFKKKYIPKNIELFVGSTSDYIRASKSQLFRDKKIKWIFPPIDENKFYPGSKIEARSYFGINSGKKVIFYGASEFKYTRKGGKYFLDAMLQLKNLKFEGKSLIDDLVILIAGRDWQKNFENSELPIIDVGYLSEDELIKAYQAADVFISPSVEDSGPAMVLQSIMCGTPIVAFNTGIAMDIVKKGETGYLAQLADPDDLANGIKYMLTLSQKELNAISTNCRQLGLLKYTTDKYLKVLIDAFPVKKSIKEMNPSQSKQVVNY